jgi:transcription factor TFIIIB component B''
MLKGKGKAFKPKISAAQRRPQSAQPSQTSRETTREPTREPTPSLKRKEREDEAPAPPPKRIPSPAPRAALTAETSNATLPEPTVVAEQARYPTPEPTQPTSAPVPSESTQPTPSIEQPTSEPAQQVVGAPPTPAPTEETPQNESPQDPPQDVPALAERESMVIDDEVPAAEEQLEASHDAPSVTHEEAQPSTSAPSLPADRRITGLGPVGDSGLGPAGDPGQVVGAQQVARVSEIVPMAALNPDGTTEEIIEKPASAADKTKKKKVVRRKKVQAAQEGDDVRATVEMQLNRPRRGATGKRPRKKKEGEKRRKQRASTPEGAEDEQVDHSVLTMSDLCKDLRIGKKFSKHEEIKKRNDEKKKVSIRAKLAEQMPGLNPEAEGAAGDSAAAQAGGEAVSEPPVMIGQAAQMRLVDGQLVLDETSLQIDRHKRAQLEVAEYEEVEENDFTRITTSGTYMKRERAQIWDAAANELFYQGLRQFGTDFEMIAKMFPHRNRRQIKLKYNKEERTNAAKLNRALLGEKTEGIDLEEYKNLTGLEFEDVAAIDAERAAIDRDHNAEQEKHAAEAAEQTRKKKEAINARGKAARRILDSVDDDDGPGESAKENHEPSASKSREASAAPKSKKGKAVAKPSKKNKHSHRGGGEEVEVFGDL